MPRVPKAGDEIGGYKLIQHLNTGAMAWSFSARSPEGDKVFFKAYKSPAVAVQWFHPYVVYQQELNRRAREPGLKRFCVKQVASFVHTFGIPTFFQVYEFVEGGHDLETVLAKIRKDPSSLSWNQRLILAKVMMAGIHQLHEAKIVHCDLKPANLQMIIDPSIEAHYQLKLIDMDFSVLADRNAPWNGIAAYVGTPRYFSPEHLRGEVPKRASDIFTCGIILYELLAAGHPFSAETDEEYYAKIKANDPPMPKLVGALPRESATKYLSEVLQRCLTLDSAKRPTAKEVNLALNGRQADSTEVVARAGTIRLTNGVGTPLSFNIAACVGRDLLRQFGEASRFADDHQFTLEPRDGEWWLVPRPETMNFTLYNEKPLDRPIRLNRGDKIEIGSRASGRTVLPLTVEL